MLHQEADQVPSSRSRFCLMNRFERLYIDLYNAPLSQIVKMTGCKRPCSYKEYKFLNTNLKEFSYYYMQTMDYPKDQVVFCL